MVIEFLITVHALACFALYGAVTLMSKIENGEFEL